MRQWVHYVAVMLCAALLWALALVVWRVPLNLSTVRFASGCALLLVSAALLQHAFRVEPWEARK